MRQPVNYVAIVQKFSKSHRGIDYGWNSNHGGQHQAIYAVEDGEVIYKFTQTSGGKVLHIKHDNGYVSEYGHLDTWLVNKGDKVKKGQKIATMGATGKVTGPHLHFGLYKGSSINYSKDCFVNPLPYLCLYNAQETNAKTKLLYTINKTKTVKNVPSEPLLVRNASSKIVGRLYNGDEVEYFGKTGTKAIVDKINNYTTVAKYLK